MAQNVFFGTLLGQLALGYGRNFGQSGRLPIFQLYKHLANCLERLAGCDVVVEVVSDL